MVRAELSSASAKAQEALAGAAQRALEQSTAAARARFDTALQEAKAAADDASAAATTTTTGLGQEGSLLRGSSGASVCAKATAEAAQQATNEFDAAVSRELEGVTKAFEAEVRGRKGKQQSGGIYSRLTFELAHTKSVEKALISYFFT